ncbi:MAG: hypothetical protein ABEJ83_02270 [Candidatus Nanohaloarchaea archaeon]
MAIAAFTAAYKLFKKNKLGWFLAITVFSISLTINIAASSQIPGAIAQVIMNALVLFYLTLQKKHFE